VFGVVKFVYACNGQFLALEADMERPRKFPNVFRAAFVVAAALNVEIAGIIVHQFGDDREPNLVLEAGSVGNA